MKNKDIKGLQKELGKGKLIEASFMEYYKAIILTIDTSMIDYNSDCPIYLNKTFSVEEKYETFSMIHQIFPNVQKVKAYYTSYVNTYEVMMDKFGNTSPWKIIDDSDIKMLDVDCKYIFTVPKDTDLMKLDGMKVGEWEIILHYE